VRKVQDAFPSMITLGRTHNNDIVIDDVQVSKFHAYFKLEGDRIELTDAGSSNGTLVNGTALEPKTTCVVSPGDLLVFGPLEFVLLQPAECWQRLVDALEHRD
jgi:pSer/pThr/pTyr-binding forkhead associated (FHA) protein